MDSGEMNDLDYLKAAKDTVIRIKNLQKELEDTEQELKRSKRAVAQEEKGINAEIDSISRGERDTIAEQFDKQLDDNSAKIKSIQTKKEKKKNQRMETRIERATAELKEENRRLESSLRALFKDNHVPGFCALDIYYCLFSPKGIDEIIGLIIIMIIACIGLPSLVITILLDTKFGGGGHGTACAIIWAVIIIVEFVLYFIVFNATKVRYSDAIRSGRKIKDNVRANEKRINKIQKKILKDKDESVYRLDKYDKKIRELERVRAEIGRQKAAALKKFDEQAKREIINSVNGRRGEKLGEIKARCDGLEQQKSAIKAEINELNDYIIDEYEPNIGKGFCTEDKLSDLISIMEEDMVISLDEAKEIYKGEGM